MEKPDVPPEYRDDESGALARRMTALGRINLDENVLLSCTMKGMSRWRAIDKQTASDLFKIAFPDGHGLNDVLAIAIFSLELRDNKGHARATVHRLPNGTWIEPKYGHFILPSTPWAQMLEQEYQHQRAHPHASESPATERPPENNGTTEKPRRRFRTLLKSILMMGP